MGGERGSAPPGLGGRGLELAFVTTLPLYFWGLDTSLGQTCCFSVSGLKVKGRVLEVVLCTQRRHEKCGKTGREARASPSGTRKLTLQCLLVFHFKSEFSTFLLFASDSENCIF